MYNVLFENAKVVVLVLRFWNKFKKKRADLRWRNRKCLEMCKHIKKNCSPKAFDMQRGVSLIIWEHGLCMA